MPIRKIALVLANRTVLRAPVWREIRCHCILRKMAEQVFFKEEPKMIVHQWPTPIYYAETENWQEHVPELRAAILVEMSRSENQILDGKKHNVWDWQLPSVRWLRQTLTRAANTYLQNMDIVLDNAGAYWGRSWGNVMQLGCGVSRQELHAHHEADFFAVFYVDGDATDEHNGQLALYDPRFANNTHLLHRKNRITLQPRTGYLLLAPGNVWHEVQPYNKYEPRITIASNFQYSLMKVRE